ncbi:MAG TPA: LCP family protein, partial [Angustibacter sp.]|nr:LCP family protein [Angustibacter sp.]
MISTGGTPRGSGRAPDGAPGQGVRPPSAGGRRPQRAGAGRGGSGGGYGGYGVGAAPAPAPVGPIRRRRRFPVKTVVLLVVLAIIAYPLALLAVAWTHLGRVDALPADTSATPGRTYLVVGSDSRKGLTKEQARALHTGGGDVGQRTDTIMLLHVPAGGGPTVIMSIPRDSYVAIPGHGHNKINAAFAFGGPKLLAQTIEDATGVQIDDYAEIGFG